MTNEELVQRIQDGAEDKTPLYGQLYDQNKGLIRIISKRYACGEPLEDMMQEAYFPLVSAADNYDPDKGASFATYAGAAIGRHLFQYRARVAGMIARSEAKERLLLAYYRLADAYQEQLHRPPMDGEIAAFLDISQEQAQRIRQEAGMSVMSLYTPVGDGEDMTLLDTLPDPHDPIEDAQEEMQDKELAALLWAQVDKLEARQRAIIKARYKDHKPMTRIYRDVGTSYQNAVRIEKLALRKLSENTALRDYLEIRSPYRGTGLSIFQNTFTSAPELAAIRAYSEERITQLLKEVRK